MAAAFGRKRLRRSVVELGEEPAGRGSVSGSRIQARRGPYVRRKPPFSQPVPPERPGPIASADNLGPDFLVAGYGRGHLVAEFQCQGSGARYTCNLGGVLAASACSPGGGGRRRFLLSWLKVNGSWSFADKFSAWAFGHRVGNRVAEPGSKIGLNTRVKKRVKNQVGLWVFPKPSWTSELASGLESGTVARSATVLLSADVAGCAECSSPGTLVW